VVTSKAHELRWNTDIKHHGGSYDRWQTDQRYCNGSSQNLPRRNEL